MPPTMKPKETTMFLLLACSLALDSTPPCAMNCMVFQLSLSLCFFFFFSFWIFGSQCSRSMPAENSAHGEAKIVQSFDLFFIVFISLYVYFWLVLRKWKTFDFFFFLVDRKVGIWSSNVGASSSHSCYSLWSSCVSFFLFNLFEHVPFSSVLHFMLYIYIYIWVL